MKKVIGLFLAIATLQVALLCTDKFKQNATTHNQNTQKTIPQSTVKEFKEFAQCIDDLPKFHASPNYKKKKDDFCITKNELKKSILDAVQATATIYKKNGFLEDKNVAQKLIVPAGSSIAIHADLHGDVKSLLALIRSLQNKGFMSDWKIIKDNFYIVLIGDYTDRGLHDIEVLYTITQLKIINKEKVILLRGNHEDTNINMQYGLLGRIDEFMPQDPESFEILTELAALYDLLPEVLFLGCKENDKTTNYMMICHGGIEPDYNPRPLLMSNKNFDCMKLLNGNLQRHKYLWNDFQVDPKKKTDYTSGGRKKLGKETTKKYLEGYSGNGVNVVGIIRGHQQSGHHTPMMKSIVDEKPYGISKLWEPNTEQNKNKLWPNIVCTLNVAPDTPYGKKYPFNYDTYALLTVQQKMDDWRLEPIQTNPLNIQQA